LSHVSPVGYGLLILAGIFAIGVLPPLLLLRFRKPDWKAALAGAGSPAAGSGGNPG
jgi:hypothetical protein